MKVLVGPRIDLGVEREAAIMCRLLAGEDGAVICLADLGIRNLYRQLSPAEIHALRDALRGDGDVDEGVRGYVCRGVSRQNGGTGWIAVTDHANLTWRSPLAGPNDDRVGPRFPSMHKTYAPEAVLAQTDAQDGMIVAPGVIAGVWDDRAAASSFEIDVIKRHRWAGASSELVAPVIIAAHMGLRMAAAVKMGYGQVASAEGD